MSQFDVILLTGRDQSMAVIKPFGAHKCAHELRAAGFRTLVVNHINHFNDTEILTLISASISSKTLFVGISNTFLPEFCRRKLSSISDMIRRHNPRCKIVLGGAAASTVDQYPGIDYLVIGYADLSIVNLAQHLRQGHELQKSRRSVYGFTVIDDAVAEGFDVQNSTMTWHDDDLIVNDRVLPLEVSRGCIFRCAFCSFILNGKKNGDYIKNIGIIRDELMKNYEKFGIRTYRILDDTFNDNRSKLDQFEAMVAGLPFRLQLWAYIRLDLLSKHPDTIDQLVRIGVRSMAFGIETFNKATGRIIGKGYDPEQQIETLREIKRRHGNDVILTAQFIVGLPQESLASITNSINRMRSGDIPLDGWHFGPLNIRRSNTSRWDSPFNLDMQRYGYSDTGKPLAGNMVHWQNQYMDFDQAKRISVSGSRRFEGHQEFEIYALGHEFDAILASGEAFTSTNLIQSFNLHVTTYKQHVLEYVTAK